MAIRCSYLCSFGRLLPTRLIVEGLFKSDQSPDCSSMMNSMKTWKPASNNTGWCRILPLGLFCPSPGPGGSRHRTWGRNPSKLGDRRAGKRRSHSNCSFCIHSSRCPKTWTCGRWFVCRRIEANAGAPLRGSFGLPQTYVLCQVAGSQ